MHLIMTPLWPQEQSHCGKHQEHAILEYKVEVTGLADQWAASIWLAEHILFGTSEKQLLDNRI